MGDVSVARSGKVELDETQGPRVREILFPVRLARFLEVWNLGAFNVVTLGEIFAEMGVLRSRVQ